MDLNCVLYEHLKFARNKVQSKVYEGFKMKK